MKSWESKNSLGVFEISFFWLLILWRFFGRSLRVLWRFLCGFFKGSSKVLWGSVDFLGSFGRVFTLGFLVEFFFPFCFGLLRTYEL